MNDLTLWVLSIGGESAGFYILLAMAILFFIITVISHHNNNYSNRRLRFIYRWRRVILWSVLVITYVTIYFSSSATFDAPTLWFKNLPAGEIRMMKKEISKHDGPLSIHQFYEAKLLAQKENHRQEQLDAMKDGVVYSTKK